MITRRQFVSGIGLASASELLLGSNSGFWARPLQAKSLNLKITGLKTFIVNVGNVNWVFCKVYTNQGLTGLGSPKSHNVRAGSHRYGRYRRGAARGWRRAGYP